MPVIEAPTWHDWPVLAHGLQRYGHFVLFRFDPLASVASLDDAEASRAAALLPQESFLGIVIKNAGFQLENSKGVHVLNLSIYVVGVGAPEPTSAAIPISPAAQLADSHPPIQLPSELPWPNLYAHSFYTVVAVISRIHDGPDYFSVSLTEEQLQDLSDTVLKDLYHRHNDVWEEMVRNAGAKQAEPAAPEDPGSESEGRTDSSGSGDFMLSDEAQLITEKYAYCRTYVELWLDPASCPGQPAPLSACEALKTRLDEITKDWYDRKIREAKGRRSQLIAEWNHRVRDTAGDKAEIHAPEFSPEGTFVDELVLPEDAVDYRIQPRVREAISDHPPAVSPPEPVGACEDNATALMPDNHAQLAHDAAGESAHPDAGDTKGPSDSPAQSSPRPASTKQAAFKRLRAVILRVKARIMRDA